MAFHHREWIGRLPPLHTTDGAEFDKGRVVLYAYLHSYAQRHADAGVPIDVLRELMDHRKLDTTKGYYRVGESRRREAVDRVAALAFGRHGNPIWRQAQALLDSEHARRALREVAVLFGVCTEPSTFAPAAAPARSGSAAPAATTFAPTSPPFRTCGPVSTTSFATVSACSRDRELDEWARREAMPSGGGDRSDSGADLPGPSRDR